jgi:hypothetical protein
MALTNCIIKSSIYSLKNLVITPQDFNLNSQLIKQAIKGMTIFQISILKGIQKDFLQLDNLV